MNALVNALRQLPQPWTGLRAELSLQALPGGSYLLEDPLSGDLYQLNSKEQSVLKTLAASAPGDLQRVCESCLRQQLISLEDLIALLEHCQQAGFCRGQPRQQAKSSGLPVWRWPLWRPQVNTQAIAARYGFWLSPKLNQLIGLIGLLALLGIVPQLELYLSTANYLLTPTGFIALIVCLLLLKLGHELAHALTAWCYGQPVREMGLLFIVCWPLFYSDISDAWKLQKKSQRISIALAGVRFELAVAAVAGLAWCVLADGALRSLAFVFSSSALFSSLLINLNPLMRFDGYYALMDYWGRPNLKQQAAEHLRNWRRWRLWGAPAPAKDDLLLAYGLASAAWGIVIAISLTVLAGMLLGPLAAIPLALLFVRSLLWVPLKTEWRFLRQGQARSSSSTKRTLGLAALLLLFSLVPWPRQLELAATLSAAAQQQLSLPLAATLKSPLPALGQSVAAGELLAEFSNPRLQHDWQQAQQQVDLRQQQLKALLPSGEQGGLRQTAAAELRRAQQHEQALAEQLSALKITAQDDLTVLYRHAQLAPGDVIAAGEVFLIAAQPSQALLQLYVSQAQLKQLQALDGESAEAELLLANGERLAVHWQPSLQPQYQRHLPESLLDIAGGPIASQPAVNGGRQALGSWYQLRLSLDANAPVLNMPATLHLPVASKSLLMSLFSSWTTGA